MADVLEAVRGYLLSVQAVTDLIGQRFYFDRRPQGQYMPSATLMLSSESHDHQLSDRSGLVQSRIQIECFSSKRLTSNAIAAAMYRSGIAALKGLSNGLWFDGVMIEDGKRNYVLDDKAGGDNGLYVTQFDLMVTYNES